VTESKKWQMWQLTQALIGYYVKSTTTPTKKQENMTLECGA
jgi:hypothetical protein